MAFIVVAEHDSCSDDRVLTDLRIADEGAVRHFNARRKNTSGSFYMSAENYIIAGFTAVADKAERPKQGPLTRYKVVDHGIGPYGRPAADGHFGQN